MTNFCVCSLCNLYVVNYNYVGKLHVTVGTGTEDWYMYTAIDAIIF